MSKEWLSSAIFYEIYPTSFKDSNNDGIGDLKGITNKLNYVSSIGFNAIWLNPFYESPFKDGGYDVSDFFKVDPRFGSMDDFKELLDKAHSLSMHVIIDLVAGHASEKNKDFLKSAEPTRNEYSDLFIWNNSVWELEQPYRLISGRYDRNACYMVNFFSTQPAFNYGFNMITHPSWQMSYKDQRTKIARDYLKKIIRYWLNLGADGFRVDMADSLVKNDDEKIATMEIWKEIHHEIFEKEFKNAILVSEWSNPAKSLACGFDCDFVLDHLDNFAHRLSRSTKFTRGDSVLNHGDQILFKEDLERRLTEAKNNKGYLGIISGNHDTTRVASFLNPSRLRMFYMAILTIPGIPFIYYGDEIGMKHADLTSKDGGYQRTGDRTPMEWDNSINKGFSDTTKELYLPLNNDSLNVYEELKDSNSLLNYIKNLISFRKEHSFISDAKLEFINSFDGSLIYKINNLKVVFNLSEKPIKLNDIKKLVFVSNSDALNNNELKEDASIVYEF